MIDKLKANPTQFPLPRTSQQIYPAHSAAPASSQPAPIDPAVNSDRKFDPSLERLRTGVKHVVDTGSDAVYDEILDKHIKDFQRQVHDIPDLLNFAAHVIIQIGNKATHNLFRRREGHRSAIVEPYLKSLMNSLLRSIDKATLRNSLENQLKERISNINPPLTFAPNQRLEHYIQPILNELFHIAEHNTHLRVEELFYSANFSPDQRTIDVVFETAARLLVETKIRQSLNILHDTMQRDLSQIVKRFFKANALKISDILFCRFGELISNMEYKDTFDKIFVTINQQAEGYISAEKTVDDLIAKAKLPDTSRTNPEEKERLQKCREEMAALGEEKYKEQKILQAFSMERACHPVIQNMMCHPPSDHLALEDSVYSDLCDQIIRLILPKKKILIDGRTHEIDGVAHLWQQLVVPQELMAIFDHYKDLLLETFTNETGNAIASLKHPIGKFVENIIVTYVHDELKSYFVFYLKQMLQQVTNPQTFKQFAAMNVIPMIFEEIIPVYAETLLTADIDHFSPKFKLLLDDRATAQLTENAILIDLFTQFKTKSSLFKNAQTPIDETKFRQKVLPLIQDIKRVLLLFRTNDEKDNQELIEKTHGLLFAAAKSSCQFYTNGSKKPDDEAYAAINKLIASLPDQLDSNVDPAKKEIIINKLKEKSKSLLAIIKEIGPTSDDSKIYSSITAPFSDEIKPLLHNRTIAHENIKAQILQYSTSTKVPNAPPVYGDLILNLVFGLGKFEVGGLGSYFANWEMVKNIIKDKTSEAMLGALSQIRENHQIPINTVADKIGDLLINREQLHALLTQANTPSFAPPAPEVVQATYNARMGQVATLAHDIVNQIIDMQFSAINPMRSIAKSAVGADPSNILKLCTNLFDRLFKEKLLIENLVFKVQDTVLQALHEADGKLRRQNAVPANNYVITNPLVA